MNPAGLANASSGFLWGDYEGITAQGNSFYGVFTGQSIGRATVQLDPIFFTAPATQIIWPNICKLHPEICFAGPIVTNAQRWRRRTEPGPAFPSPLTSGSGLADPATK